MKIPIAAKGKGWRPFAPVAQEIHRQASWGLPTSAFVLLPSTLALQTAGDAETVLPFGLTIESLQQGVLIYLGLSSLVFVVVWVVGYLRRG